MSSCSTGFNQGAPINGFLGVDKPPGWTSQDVVGWVRNHFSIKKVGHTGTLDPMATGVVVLALNAYTRLSSFVTGSTKRYRAVVRLGAKTDTLDADGTITQRSAVGVPTLETVESALDHFKGKISQIPPMYSAIRVAGRRLYELARKGVEVERAPRDIEIYALDVIAYRWPLLHLDVRCSKGTYIRSLADDIGQLLGCGGFLVTLRRTSVGPVGLDRCLSMKSLRLAEETGSLSESLIAHEVVLHDVPSVSLSADQLKPFSNGNSVEGLNTDTTGTVRVLNLQAELLGVGHVDGGVLKPQRVIHNR